MLTPFFILTFLVTACFTGCNVEATADLARAIDIPVIASGGIRDLDDIRKLLDVEYDGVTMAVLGRSLYEHTLDFKEALELVKITNRTGVSNARQKNYSLLRRH